MSLTPQWLDELRARTTLSTLIGKTTKVQKAGREYKACCPFHNEKTPSFTINDEKGFYHCLAAETVVLTRRGRARIADLAGQVAEVLGPSGRWIAAPFANYGEQQLWEIALSRNGVRKSIFATARHRWFVRGRKSEVLTQALQPGARLLAATPEAPTQWTLDPAGVRHGLIFGDGTMFKQVYGTINLHGAENMALACWFPDQEAVLCERDGGKAYLRLYGGRAFEGMKALPSPHSTDAYLLGFLAGYLAADGHVAKDGTVMLNSARRDHLEAVRDIASALGVVTYGLTTQNRRGINGLTSDLHRIHFATSSLAPEFFLKDEARRRFEECGKAFERLRWTVQSVVPTDRTEAVFCAQVPKDHAFALDDDILTGNCFGCGAHGDAIRWMTDQRGLPFLDAIKDLAAAAGMEVPAPDPRAAKRAEKAQSLHDVTGAAQDWFVEQLGSPEGSEARAYINKRGITPATQAAFGFGFSPDSRTRLKTALAKFPNEMLVESGMLIQPEEEKRESYDRFRGRLMIPIRDQRGRVIAFGGRILSSGEPKYLNSPETPIFDKGRTLYNLDKAAPAARKSGRIVVAEGYMDVIMIAQAGIAEAVAPLGTALTEAQMEKLWSMVETPILCFDGDNAGQRAALRAAHRALPLLKPGHSLSFATLPSGQDPDDLIRAQGVKAFEAVLEAAIPLVELLWRTEQDAAPLSTPEQRAGLKQRLKALTDQIADGDIRAHYVRSFKERHDALFFGDRSGGARAPFQPAGQRGGSGRGAMKNGRWTLPPPPPTDEARAVSGTAADTLLLRAVLAGLLRFPGEIIVHRESLAGLYPPDADLAHLLDALLEASYREETVETGHLLTILGKSDVYNMAKGLLRADALHFTFTRDEADRRRAQRDLAEAIAVIVAMPRIDAELEAVTRAMAEDLDEATFARQQALRKLKTDLVERAAELAQPQGD